MKSTFTQFSNDLYPKVYGYKSKKPTRTVLSFFATLCCLLFFSTGIYAQGTPTDCGNIVCKAKDVRIGSAFIANQDGTAITCIGGEQTIAYIFLRVYSIAPRSGVFISATVLSAVTV